MDHHSSRKDYPIQNTIDFLCRKSLENKLEIPTKRKVNNKIHRGNIRCHFCGAFGHIKKTCKKKQNFDTSKLPRQNLNCKSQKPLPYESEFLNTIRLLDILQIKPTSLPELRQLRIVIDTLIYFHTKELNFVM